jgi:hypothetical protein
MINIPVPSGLVAFPRTMFPGPPKTSPAEVEVELLLVKVIVGVKLKAD